MADTKISGLPASTTPLAGTEVLPIVQGGVTKQVAVQDLTAGRPISASSVTNSGLTSGRVVYSTTGGLQADSPIRTDGTNVAIGGAPSTWGAGFLGFELRGSSVSFVNGYGSSPLALTNNAYYDGSGYKYQVSSYASNFYVASGVYHWQSAASGTAGAAISFADVMSLDTSGNLSLVKTLGVGGATPASSGAGISFPATQSASSDANTLDDYEEGTWTPAYFAATGTLGAITYANVQGVYTKIGDLVYVSGSFYTTAFAVGSGSGALAITGLPFVSNASGATYALAVSDSRLFPTNNPNAAYVNINANYLTLFYRTTANGAISTLQVSDASTAGGATNLVAFSGCYRV